MTWTRTRGALLAGFLVLVPGCGGGDPAAQELKDIESAFGELREAVLRDDDERFFSMHCREAREAALRDFPAVRSGFLALPAEERRAVEQELHLSGGELATGEPRALVVKMLPWKSGWKGRKEVYRRSRVKQVRIEMAPVPGGGEERRGVVTLDITAALDPSNAQPIPENYLPTVIFVKDPEGWRRRTFFVER
jgi:hypothetical protein